MLTARPVVKPFTGGHVKTCAPVVVPSKMLVRPVRAAEDAAAAAAEPGPDTFEDAMDTGLRSRRSGAEKGMELKHFLPLPKPSHLVFVKPTVAVVAGMASRSSVGVKMTAGDQQLERYVIEYYARSVK